MFEVDVKYVIEQQQGRSRTSLGLGVSDSLLHCEQ